MRCNLYECKDLHAVCFIEKVQVQEPRFRDPQGYQGDNIRMERGLLQDFQSLMTLKKFPGKKLVAVKGNNSKTDAIL